MSKIEAKALKKEMLETSGGIFSTNVSLKEQKKTLMSLNKELGGTAIVFNRDILEGASDTLNRLHLSETAVGNMAKQAMIAGKSFKALEKEQAKGVLDAEREFGIRLKLSDVLDETNKITGIARVNAMGIEGGLAKAVATAKSLGIEMSAVASSAGQLLDFESSIQNELQAELLIGRDLNLEKARSAALAGDQEALAKALVEEAGSLEELQSMNVLQQQALAGALGMSADQLADSLVNQEALSTQAQTDLDREASQALQQEKILSLTEKQSLAMTKAAEAVQSFGSYLAVAAAAAMAVGIGLTLGAGAGPIIAGALAAGAVAYGFTQMVEDGVAPPESGPFTITDKFGATAITAAGDGLAVSPNINTTGEAGGNANVNVDMSETNMLLKQILSKEGTVQMDSTDVGTSFAVGSRQIQ
jgi:ParB-like chromosome segregation protein Spo0J